ncbi:Clp protease N-terminal domain-containing protein [Amorphoplanes digitatis]|uniref:ATP-dependent Clp protease ATP-binding subunit ClpA n=1 Tax=Actinoplanes digitatis TaxID=1868 RepID=A0A7W7HUX2_9ACTN|nr:Clp protease N-terminal domain-containing protein [Actinoplanes digitatis]MBB4761148.1 ATP-dependent Clp protease ATP-binding subunit ClpA [Actinoplanes digitatis]BFE69510.1 Clp protease N-terminal domain-containing protein [Actinoplanes digitatis]GID92764.1 Clp protease [Actinoplanes digitatis]
MFERFTHAARTVVVRAQEEARDLRQEPIGTQHVLLSLLADADGPVASAPALRDRHVDAAYARAEIIRRVDGGATPYRDALAEADAEDAAALKAIGIDLDAVRRAIEENFGPGALRLPRDTAPKRRGLLRRFYGSGHTPFSPRSKKVLELSLREAIRLKHNFIAPEHLMLGILREGEGLAVQILTEAGVDLARLREDVTRSLRDQAA